MPQLVPFYFINEVTFTFIIITLGIIIFSKYNLPNMVRIYISRIYLKKI